MPLKQPDPVYLTDDFPRDGCRIAIDIQASSYDVVLFAPGGGRHPIELYSCRSTEALSVLIQALASGEPVPRDLRAIDRRVELSQVRSQGSSNS